MITEEPCTTEAVRSTCGPGASDAASLTSLAAPEPRGSQEASRETAPMNRFRSAHSLNVLIPSLVDETAEQKIQLFPLSTAFDLDRSKSPPLPLLLSSSCATTPRIEDYVPFSPHTMRRRMKQQPQHEENSSEISRETSPDASPYSTRGTTPSSTVPSSPSLLSSPAHFSLSFSTTPPAPSPFSIPLEECGTIPSAQPIPTLLSPLARQRVVSGVNGSAGRGGENRNRSSAGDLSPRGCGAPRQPFSSISNLEGSVPPTTSPSPRGDSEAAPHPFHKGFPSPPASSSTTSLVSPRFSSQAYPRHAPSPPHGLPRPSKRGLLSPAASSPQRGTSGSVHSSGDQQEPPTTKLQHHQPPFSANSSPSNVRMGGVLAGGPCEGFSTPQLSPVESGAHVALGPSLTSSPTTGDEAGGRGIAPPDKYKYSRSRSLSRADELSASAALSSRRKGGDWRWKPPTPTSSHHLGPWGEAVLLQAGGAREGGGSRQRSGRRSQQGQQQTAACVPSTPSVDMRPVVKELKEQLSAVLSSPSPSATADGMSLNSSSTSSPTILDSSSSSSSSSSSLDSAANTCHASARFLTAADSVLSNRMEGLRKLLRFNPSNKSGFVSAGGVPPLIQVLSLYCRRERRLKEPGIQLALPYSCLIEHAVTALYNLTNLAPAVEEILAHQGGVDAVVEVLHVGNDAAKENAAAALFMLANQAEGGLSAEQKRTCAALAVAPLADMLRNASSGRGRKDACLALFVLSCDELCRQFLIMAGVVETLIEAMEEQPRCCFGSPSPVSSSGKPPTPDSFGQCSSGQGRDAQSTGGGECTTERQQQEESASFEEKACAVLANVSTCAEGCAAIVATGGIASLAEVVEAGWSERAREQAVSALLNVACCDDHYLPAIAAEGLALPLAKLVVNCGREEEEEGVGSRRRSTRRNSISTRQRRKRIVESANELLALVRSSKGGGPI